MILTVFALQPDIIAAVASLGLNFFDDKVSDGNLARTISVLETVSLGLCKAVCY